ncbi:uncharacterized protein [Amphiura filiformis]|uniref:uncharacterized protein n=1 Tax=Amphiura filiformis TaxID=82378 RepID=UPI003B20E9E7
MEDQEGDWKISESDLQYYQRIGDGANGEVYLVTLKGKHGETVEAAAKTLNEKTSVVDEERKREQIQMLEEVDILRKVKHPNIIQFICAVLHPMIIIVTEYAAQGSLYNYLKNISILPTRQRNDWMHQAASAVQYLHQNDIVHLDVKSNNFVVMQNGILKLCDFGTAKNLVRTEETDRAKGTIPWMAPEIIADMLISKSSDVFSLGVLIWELITCEIPYYGDHPYFIQYQVAQNNLRPTIPETCPDDLKRLLKSCWEDDRKRRPKIDEVVEAIVRIVCQGKVQNDIIMDIYGSVDQALAQSDSSTSRKELRETLSPVECFQSPPDILAAGIEAGVEAFEADVDAISNMGRPTQKDELVDIGENNHGYESDATEDTIHTEPNGSNNTEDNNRNCGHSGRICLVIVFISLALAAICLSTAAIFGVLKNASGRHLEQEAKTPAWTKIDCHGKIKCSENATHSLICTQLICDEGYTISAADGTISCQIEKDGNVLKLDRTCIKVETVATERTRSRRLKRSPSTEPAEKTDVEHTTLADYITSRQQTTDNPRQTTTSSEDQMPTLVHPHTTSSTTKPESSSIATRIITNRSDVPTTLQQISTKMQRHTEQIQRSALMQTLARRPKTSMPIDLIIEGYTCYFNITANTEPTSLSVTPANHNCSSWIITVPDGYLMVLNITANMTSGIGCNGNPDVEVRDGPDISNKKLPGRRSGIPDPNCESYSYSSTGCTVWIQTRHDLEVVVTTTTSE